MPDFADAARSGQSAKSCQSRTTHRAGAQWPAATQRQRGCLRPRSPPLTVPPDLPSSSVSSFLAAALQIETSSADPEANFTAPAEEADSSWPPGAGAELFGLPENLAFMGDDSPARLELAPSLAERCSAFSWSRWPGVTKSPCWGGFPCGRPRAVTSIRAEFGGQGQASCLARYAKSYLFSMWISTQPTYRESE